MDFDAECPWGDWHYNPSDPPLAAYLGREWLPLRWVDGEFRTVHPTDGLKETIPTVALAHHLVTVHPELTSVRSGTFRVDTYPPKDHIP